MKSLFLFLALSLMSMSAFAGFRGYNANTDLKLFSAIGCDSGLECSRGTKDRLLISVDTAAFEAPTAAVAGSLTSAQCGQTFYNSGAVALNLPEASTVIGCKYSFVTLNAANFDINPDDADQILVQTDAAGDMIRNATLGNTITLQAVSASQWVVTSILGTWTDAN